MNLFTRISATLTGTVDNMVSHVENHDAVIQAALKETRAAVAKARIQLSRVQKDGDALQRRLTEAQKMEKVWAERAVSTAKSDEDKALECIARRNHCREMIANTTDAIKRHKQTEKQIADNVATMEKRLSTIQQQQNTMRSRQSTAEAQRIINKIGGQSGEDIDNVFDRWEMLVTEQEYLDGSISELDALDMEFSKRESDNELKAELDALMNDLNHKE